MQNQGSPVNQKLTDADRRDLDRAHLQGLLRVGIDPQTWIESNPERREVRREILDAIRGRAA